MTIKKQPKNLLLVNNSTFIKRQKLLCSLLPLFFALISRSQIANYVSNGSFEELYNCNPQNIISKAKFWNGIDSINGGWPLLIAVCYSNVPVNGGGFQFPRTGNNYIRSGFLCIPPTCSPTINRLYLRNRLKQNLQPGKIYCVKFHVNLTNPSTYGIDQFSAYFGDNTLDTITKTTIPLTYLNPQINNQINNLITDTLIWTAITGTFIATGNEKYMVIGNFKSDSNTNKILINPTNLPAVFSDACVDDVSCIPLDLPAYAAAGNDIWAIPGNTVYLGRPQDVGIDEACMWYKLPNITTAIDTAAGITVTVGLTTNTYVVKQDICGNIKYDTVVVHASGVGNVELEMLNDKLTVYPNPAKEILNIELQILNKQEPISNLKFIIYNSLGQLVREEDVIFKDNIASINTKELANGVYNLILSSRGTRCTEPAEVRDLDLDSSYRRNDNVGNASKRFVIAR